jgi:hypothetical protein
VPAKRADHTQLDLAGRDPLDDGERVGDRERDAKVGMLPLELAEQDGHEVGAGAGRGGQRERSGESSLVSGGDLLEHLVLELEHALRAPVEALPGLGRLDPPARAVEEALAESLLERPDLQADRGLGHAQALGGLREALAVDDRAERGQLARVHKTSLYLRRSGLGAYTPAECGSGSTSPRRRTSSSSGRSSRSSGRTVSRSR